MSLPDVPNFMLYRLTWNQEKGRYKKLPCRLDGSSLGRGETPPMTTRAAAEQALAALPTGQYTLGFWITAEHKLFFIDLDECVDPNTGVMTPDASSIAAPFVAAGCYFEASSSGNGAHIVGSYTGELPAHCNQRPKVHHHGFYTHSRGIALNLPASQGDMRVDATGLLLAMLPDAFPPRVSVTAAAPVGERRPEWRGPEDDDELIRRALAARGSVAAAFGQRASFADLWNGNVELNNESDLALASHLAFWTGCDVDRIERLMRRSGLKRSKWDEHRTYLRDITITHACATTQNVYQEPQRVDTAKTLVGDSSADWNTVVESVIAKINNTGTYGELMDQVVPEIPGMGIPPIRAERIVTALRKRLELFDSKPPVAQLRQLVCPPSAALNNQQRPEWIGSFCYVKRTDEFYNVVTGGRYSHESFRMEYSRLMPFKPNGSREDPVGWARDRWDITTVDDMSYRPDEEVFFEYAGNQYANLFRADSMPPMATPSAECMTAIQGFQQHLYLLCGHRDHLYLQLLMWLAHNVQKPGRKIRWSPLIKGVPGDGKSIIGDLIFAAMGESNVKITSISNINNSGGFTDWSTGRAVNFIEEIRLEGKEKRKLYNAMKNFIGDTRIDLNRKGKAAGDTERNITNHWANTNYGDAVPVDDGERRWCVMFTPYTTIEEAAAAKGLASVDELVKHFKMLGGSMRAEPGAWRSWLMGIDTSSFDPDGRAPDTPERESMKLMSSDPLDQAVVDVLERGGPGVTKDVFSSGRLAGQVQIAYGERPHDRGWNTLLTRLGYMQMPKTVWWDGTAHRIWAKKTMDADQIREILDKTK